MDKGLEDKLVENIINTANIINQTQRKGVGSYMIMGTESYKLFTSAFENIKKVKRKRRLLKIKEILDTKNQTF